MILLLLALVWVENLCSMFKQIDILTKFWSIHEQTEATFSVPNDVFAIVQHGFRLLIEIWQTLQSEKCTGYDRELLVRCIVAHKGPHKLK